MTFLELDRAIDVRDWVWDSDGTKAKEKKQEDDDARHVWSE